MVDLRSLRLVQQASFVHRFAMVTLGIILVFTAILFLPWQQTVKGVGTLTAMDPTQRDYKISATVDGFIEKIYVKENQFVKKGERLFSMKDLDEKYHDRLVQIKSKSQQMYENEMQKLENLQKNLSQQKEIYKITVEIYENKITQLKNSLRALSEQKTALKNKERIDLIQLRRSRSLFNDGIESKRDLELNENTYMHTAAKHERIVADIENAAHDFEIVKKEKRRFVNETEQTINTIENSILASRNLANTLHQNIQKDSIALGRYRSSDVVAKSDGYVLRIYQNDTNRLLKKGDEILYFSPVVGKRAIRLKVSDFYMPLIKKGLKARIIFYGWPAMQISGWPKIEHGTYAGIVHSIERSAYEKGVYYAMITEDSNDSPWPSREDLRIGTQAAVWVRLGVVPIWYELWRLMVAQPPAMVSPPEGAL